MIDDRRDRSCFLSSLSLMPNIPDMGPKPTQAISPCRYIPEQSKMDCTIADNVAEALEYFCRGDGAVCCGCDCRRFWARHPAVLWTAAGNLPLLQEVCGADRGCCAYQGISAGMLQSCALAVLQTCTVEANGKCRELGLGQFRCCSCR